MHILKRTFAAKNAKSEEERIKLNQDSLTSEYMPSYKYLLRLTRSDGKIASWSYRTKKEAEENAKLYQKEFPDWR